MRGAWGTLAAAAAAAAVLASAAPAAANSYHVDLAASSLATYATAVTSGPAGSGVPAGAFRRVDGASGPEVHPAGPALQAGWWGVVALYPPAGTAFQNSSLTVSASCPAAPGPFDVIVSDGSAGQVASWTDGAGACPAHTYPATGVEVNQRAYFAVGLKANAALAAPATSWASRFQHFAADVMDNTAPTLAEPGLPAFTASRTLTVPVTLTDSAAGPGRVDVRLDGAAATVRTASPSPSLLTGQATAGAATLSATYTATLADADGPHQVAVTGFDVAGNSATTAAHTVVLDRVPPTIAADELGAWTRGTLTLSATAADDRAGVQSVAFQRAPHATGGWATIVSDTAAPYAASLDTAALDDGAYDFRALATDRAGNATATPARSTVVDNTAPRLARLTAPLAAAALAGAASVGAGAFDGESGVAEVALQRSPAGAARWTTIATDTDLPYATALDSTALADGAYDLRAVVGDRAGNTIASEPVRAFVDNSAPTGVAVRGDGSATAGDAGTGVERVVFQYAPAGSGAWASYGVDGDAPYAAILSGDLLTGAGYDVRVLAYDAAGNRTASEPRSVPGEGRPGFHADRGVPGGAIVVGSLAAARIVGCTRAAGVVRLTYSAIGAPRSYAILRDGVEIARALDGSVTAYDDDGAQAAGHAYQVVARTGGMDAVSEPCVAP